MRRSTRSENTGYPYEEKKSIVSSSGIVTKLNWENADSFNGNVNIKLKLKGSNRLDFVPVGKTTNVKLTGHGQIPALMVNFFPQPVKFQKKVFLRPGKYFISIDLFHNNGLKITKNLVVLILVSNCLSR